MESTARKHVYTFVQPGGLITSVYVAVTIYEHGNSVVFDRPPNSKNQNIL